MKFYVNPEVTVSVLSSEDIIVTSLNRLSDGGLYNEKSNQIGWSEVKDQLGL